VLDAAPIQGENHVADSRKTAIAPRAALGKIRDRMK
jgi:hypothetical protein